MIPRRHRGVGVGDDAYVYDEEKDDDEEYYVSRSQQSINTNNKVKANSNVTRKGQVQGGKKKGKGATWASKYESPFVLQAQVKAKERILKLKSQLQNKRQTKEEWRDDYVKGNKSGLFDPTLEKNIFKPLRRSYDDQPPIIESPRRQVHDHNNHQKKQQQIINVRRQQPPLQKHPTSPNQNYHPRENYYNQLDHVINRLNQNQPQDEVAGPSSIDIISPNSRPHMTHSPTTYSDDDMEDEYIPVHSFKDPDPSVPSQRSNLKAENIVVKRVVTRSTSPVDIDVMENLLNGNLHSISPGRKEPIITTKPETPFIKSTGLSDFEPKNSDKPSLPCDVVSKILETQFRTQELNAVTQHKVLTDFSRIMENFSRVMIKDRNTMSTYERMIVRNRNQPVADANRSMELKQPVVDRSFSAPKQNKSVSKTHLEILSPIPEDEDRSILLDDPCPESQVLDKALKILQKVEKTENEVSQYLQSRKEVSKNIKFTDRDTNPGSPRKSKTSTTQKAPPPLQTPMKIPTVESSVPAEALHISGLTKPSVDNVKAPAIGSTFENGFVAYAGGNIKEKPIYSKVMHEYFSQLRVIQPDHEILTEYAAYKSELKRARKMREAYFVSNKLPMSDIVDLMAKRLYDDIVEDISAEVETMLGNISDSVLSTC